MLPRSAQPWATRTTRAGRAQVHVARDTVPAMHEKLDVRTALLLTVAPLMWAGNAVVGRAVHELVPPLTLNFLRWAIAFALLLPFAWRALRASSGLWRHWRRYALLGLLGVGLYNSLQYMALQTSQPINVTLVGASMPIWIMVIGRLFFGTAVTGRQVMGSLCSVAGVLVVLSRGQWSELQALRLVPGDIFMILATIAWAFYSWLLLHTREPAGIRANWSAFLLAQMLFGLAWSGAFAAGEWALAPEHITWGWPLTLALVFIAVGPALIAYRTWGAGVQRAGPTVAAFFFNLTPLFAALMSAVFLEQPAQAYHVVAFVLIAGGIVVSTRRS